MNLLELQTYMPEVDVDMFWKYVHECHAQGVEPRLSSYLIWMEEQE